MARRGKISELYDLAAIEAQQATVIKMLNDVVQTISNVKPIAIDLKGAEKTKDLVTGIAAVTSGTNDMIKVTTMAVNEMGKLDKVTRSYNGSLEDQKKILDKYQGTLEVNIRQHTEYKIQVDELKKKQKELDQQRKAGTVSLSDYAEKTAALALQQNELKIASSDLMQTIKAQIKETQSAETSYDFLNHRLGQLRDLMRQLSDDEKNSAFGKQMAVDIEAIDAELKRMDASMGNFQRNVGNYAGAFQGAFSVLQSELGKVKSDIESGAFSGDALASLQRQEALLTEITLDLGKQFKSSREEARAFQEAAAKIGITLGQQSDAFQGFKDEVGQGVDALQDIKDSVKLAASDTGKLDNMVKAAQGLAGAYGVAAGAAELFGANSEEAQEATRKLAAVMTILQGLQGIQNELTRKDSIFRKAANFLIGKQTQLTVAQAAATRAGAAATDVASKATKGFGVALKAIGIGVLLSLLPILANAMGKVADLWDGITDSQEKSLETAGKAVEKEEAKLEALNQSDNVLRLQGKSENEILRLKIKQTDAVIQTREQQIKLQEETLKGQVDAAARNKRILQGILSFMTAPLQLLINTVTKVANFFGADWEFNIADSISSMIFDPKEVQEEGQKEIDEMKKSLNALKNERAGYQLEIQKNNKDAADKAQALRDKDLAAEFAILKTKAEARRDHMKEIAANEKVGLAERLKARMEQLEEERLLVVAEEALKLNNTKLTAKEREAIIAESLQKIKDLEKQSAKDLIAIQEATTKAQTDTIVQGINNRTERELKAAEDALIKELGDIEKAGQEKLELLLEEYKKGTKSKEEYEAGKLAIENDVRNKSLKAELLHAQMLLRIALLPADIRANAEKKINELKKQLRADDLKGEEEAANKSFEIQQRRKEKLQELGNELKETLFSFLTAGIDAEKNKLQESIDALEDKKQKDIEVATQSIANAQDRAAAIAEIEAKSNVQREQIERRKRQLDQERARYERVKAIADVIQNTAVAVIGAFKTDPTGILAAIIGAIGAAQIARVLATPLPKYKDGIYGDRSHPGGPAVVGDGGKPELVKEPSGKIWVTDSKAQLVNLPKGTQVFPDAEVMLRQITGEQHSRNLSLKTGPEFDQYQLAKSIGGSIEGMKSDVVKAIKEKTENHFIIEQPLKRWRSSGGNFQQFLNNR